MHHKRHVLFGILLLVLPGLAADAAKFRPGQIVYYPSMFQRYTLGTVVPCPRNRRDTCYNVVDAEGKPDTLDVYGVDHGALTPEEFASLKMPFEAGGVVFNHFHQQLHIYDEISVRLCAPGPNYVKTRLPWPCARETTSGIDIPVTTFYDFVNKKMIDDHIELINGDNYHTYLGTTTFSATTDSLSGVWQIGDARRKLVCFLILAPNGTFLSNGGFAEAPLVRGKYTFSDGKLSFTNIEAWIETKMRKDGRFSAAPDVTLSITNVADSKLEFSAVNSSGAQFIFVAYYPKGAK